MTRRKLKIHWGKRGSPLCETEHAVFFTTWVADVSCRRCVAIAFERASVPVVEVSGPSLEEWAAQWYGRQCGGFSRLGEPRDIPQVVVEIPSNEKISEAMGKRRATWESLRKRMEEARLVVIDPIADLVDPLPRTYGDLLTKLWPYVPGALRIIGFDPGIDTNSSWPPWLPAQDDGD